MNQFEKFCGMLAFCAVMAADGRAVEPARHPPEHGYEIWYEAMKPTLDEMMK